MTWNRLRRQVWDMPLGVFLPMLVIGAIACAAVALLLGTGWLLAQVAEAVSSSN